MSINEYLAHLENFIHASPIVSSYTLTIDRKTNDIVFLSGNVEFIDGSALDYERIYRIGRKNINTAIIIAKALNVSSDMTMLPIRRRVNFQRFPIINTPQPAGCFPLLPLLSKKFLRKLWIIFLTHGNYDAPFIGHSRRRDDSNAIASPLIGSINCSDFANNCSGRDGSSGCLGCNSG